MCRAATTSQDGGFSKKTLAIFNFTSALRVNLLLLLILWIGLEKISKIEFTMRIIIYATNPSQMRAPALLVLGLHL